MPGLSKGKINVFAICAQNLLQLYRVKPVLLIAQAFFVSFSLGSGGKDILGNQTEKDHKEKTSCGLFLLYLYYQFFFLFQNINHSVDNSLNVTFFIPVIEASIL